MRSGRQSPRERPRASHTRFNDCEDWVASRRNSAPKSRIGQGYVSYGNCQISSTSNRLETRQTGAGMLQMRRKLESTTWCWIPLATFPEADGWTSRARILAAFMPLINLSSTNIQYTHLYTGRGAPSRMLAGSSIDPPSLAFLQVVKQFGDLQPSQSWLNLSRVLPLEPIRVFRNVTCSRCDKSQWLV